MKINMKCPHCINCKYVIEVQNRTPFAGGYLLSYTLVCSLKRCILE